MAQASCDFFQNERLVLKKAKELIENKQYDKKVLLDELSSVVKQFEKALTDMEKILKISDDQQGYLQKTQNELKKEIKERIQTEKKLECLASIDVLTNCYNRRMGLKYLGSRLKAAKKNREAFCICYIDVNKLKYVNDNFGHGEGDKLLILVCTFIKEILSARDILCRLGGDEFLIIFSEDKILEAEEIMKRVISNINIGNKNKLKPYPISFSYGLTEINHDNTLSVDEIIQIADKKMYENKQEHRQLIEN